MLLRAPYFCRMALSVIVAITLVVPGVPASAFAEQGSETTATTDAATSGATSSDAATDDATDIDNQSADAATSDADQSGTNEGPSADDAVVAQSDTVSSESTTESDTSTDTSQYEYVEYLSDRDATGSSIGYGSLVKDAGSDGNPLTLLVDGVETTFDKGLFTHATSYLCYTDIQEYGYERFEAWVGIEDSARASSASLVEFRVEGDGEVLWRSGDMNAQSNAQHVSVDISNVKVLTLVADSRGSNSWDHSAWADAAFYKASAEPWLYVSDKEFSSPEQVNDTNILEGVYARTLSGEVGETDELVTVNGRTFGNGTEGNDLCDDVTYTTNYTEGATGTFDLTYSVTDAQGLTRSRTVQMTVRGTEEYRLNADGDYLTKPFASYLYACRDYLDEQGKAAFDLSLETLLKFSDNADAYPTVTRNGESVKEVTIDLQAAGIYMSTSGAWRLTFMLVDNEARMFHLKQWSTNYTTNNGMVGSVSFYVPVSYATDGYYYERLLATEDNASRFLSNIEDGMTDAQRSRAVLYPFADWLVYGNNGQTMDMALVDGIGVCGGNARAAMYLMQRMGLKSYWVRTDSHAWSNVKLNDYDAGGYYRVDLLARDGCFLGVDGGDESTHWHHKSIWFERGAGWPDMASERYPFAWTAWPNLSLTVQNTATILAPEDASTFDPMTLVETASSIYDGDLSASVVVDDGGLSAGIVNGVYTPGYYTLTYSVTDSQGNTETATGYVQVVDGDVVSLDSSLSPTGLTNTTFTTVGLWNGSTEVYSSGIRQNENATATFNVEGCGYTYFDAWVGINSTVRANTSYGMNGKVQLQVWAQVRNDAGELEDVQLYTSSTLGWYSTREHVLVELPENTVSVTLKNVPKGSGNNHAAWGSPRFYTTDMLESLPTAPTISGVEDGATYETPVLPTVSGAVQVELYHRNLAVSVDPETGEEITDGDSSDATADVGNIGELVEGYEAGDLVCDEGVYTLVATSGFGLETTFTFSISVSEGGLLYAAGEGENTLTVVGYKASSEGTTSVTIPATVDVDGVAYSVTSIVSGAFSTATDMTAVSIPGTVTSIASGAFEGCTQLTRVFMLDYASFDSFACADDAFATVESGLVYVDSALQEGASPIPGYSLAGISGQVSSISLSGPSKVEYVPGDELDVSDLVVAATLTDGTSFETYNYDISGYDPYVPGEQTVTVALDSATATFQVNVQFIAPTVDVQPVGGNYITGAELPEISVSATPTADVYTLAYQWYRADTETGDGVVIEGATNAAYTPTEAGYYYVEVYQTYSSDQESERVVSSRANVAVGDYPASIGSVGYDTLATALESAVDGDTVALHEDGTVSATATLNSAKTVAVEGNGHTLTRASGFTAALVNVTGSANLTLQNLTLDGGAVWTGDVDPVLGRGTTNSGLSAVQPIVTITGVGGLTLGEGAVLQNNANSSNANVAGGISAVRVNKSTTATIVIDGGTIRNMQTAYFGAAVHLRDNSTMTVKNGTIEGNYSPSNSAICSDNTATLTIDDGTFRNNKSGGTAGVIWTSTGSTTINGGTFTNNYAAGNGGVYFASKPSASLTINGGTFENNESGAAGGVIYSQKSTAVSNATFANNVATTNGGALCLTAGGTVSNVSFAENTAAAGGGIWSNGALTVDGAGFTDNSADTGAAIHIASAKQLKINGLESVQEIYLTDFSSSTPVEITAETGAMEVSLCSNVELSSGAIAAKLGTNTAANVLWNGTTLIEGGTSSARTLVMPTFGDTSTGYEVDNFRGQDSFIAPKRDGYAFAGWYTDENLTTQLSETQTEGTAYAHFVKISNTTVGTDDGILNFQGGSLRADLGTDYSAAYLRHGFNFTIPEGCTWTGKFGWYYGTTEELGHSLTGDKYVDLGNGTYRANIVFTNVPAAYYGNSIYTAMWVEYTTPDGTTVTATDTVTRIRSVSEVCTNILADGSGATEIERTLATGLSSYSAS